MATSSFRTWLAGLIVTITPGTLLVWAHLHLSGYTYNDDGSRNLGHFSKAIPPDLVLASVASLLVLTMGLLALRLARGKGVLRVPKLFVVAGGIGLAPGLLASWLLAANSTTRSALGLLALVSLVTAGAVLVSAFLCLEYILVSGIPFRTVGAPVPNRPSGALARFADQAFVIAAAGAAIAAITWLAQLVVYAIQHPCNCG